MEVIKRVHEVIKDIEISRLLFFIFWIAISLAVGRIFQLTVGVIAGIIISIFLIATTIVAVMGDG